MLSGFLYFIEGWGHSLNAEFRYGNAENREK